MQRRRAFVFSRTFFVICGCLLICLMIVPVRYTLSWQTVLDNIEVWGVDELQLRYVC